MSRDVARATLYRGAINLWVEDELTRAYLSEIWNEPGITYLIGGGNEGVRAIVEDAEKAGYPNVFALVDRDYRPSNQAWWHDPNKTFRTFILPVHEVENYLLDATAFANCRYHNRGLSIAQIVAFLSQAASRLCWWVACRDAVAELKRRFRDGFIPDPKQSVIDETAARTCICRSPWFQKLARRGESIGRGRRPSTPRFRNHAAASNRLTDGTWRDDFAGKEVLRDVGSRICDRTTIVRFPASDTEFYSDLAKEIAAWQVANNTVPLASIDLLAALKKRIAPNPPASSRH